jgi:hypothetical protein
MSFVLEPSSRGPASTRTVASLNRSQGSVVPAPLARCELAGVATPAAPARARVSRTVAPGWPGLPRPHSRPRRGRWPSTCGLLRRLGHLGSGACTIQAPPPPAWRVWELSPLPSAQHTRGHRRPPRRRQLSFRYENKNTHHVFVEMPEGGESRAARVRRNGEAARRWVRCAHPAGPDLGKHEARAETKPAAGGDMPLLRRSATAAAAAAASSSSAPSLDTRRFVLPPRL